MADRLAMPRGPIVDRSGSPNLMGRAYLAGIEKHDKQIPELTDRAAALEMRVSVAAGDVPDSAVLSDLIAAFNDLLAKLRAAGLMGI